MTFSRGGEIPFMESILEEGAKRRLEALLPLLDERQSRLFLAAEARELGRGGISAVSRITGYSRDTIRDGIHELRAGDLEPGNARQVGGGRKRATDLFPSLTTALLALVDKDSRGDPMSPLRWTTKSTRHLADVLREQGFKVSHATVGSILGDLGFSLQGNAKTKEGGSHPDRDAQFRYLNQQVINHQAAGQPVISVDTKKKELVGEFKNGGQERQPKGEPDLVKVHDFVDKELGKAIPYGVYDISRNEGWVSVGTDHDTSTFAVQTIRRWWQSMGSISYPNATELLITADGGGSNGSRVRLWKRELSALSEELGLQITVCHLPPGTSKWNKIEHRLFSHIAMNWRGRPLVDHEVIVELIGATTTKTGLKVGVELDRSPYPTGQEITDSEFEKIVINRHAFHGDWNYTFPSKDGPSLP
jgi:transposase